jgi:hypothetical protein
METAILVLQILCAAGLALGTALSLYQLLMQSGNERFTHAVANDFETGYRRLVRNRRR